MPSLEQRILDYLSQVGYQPLKAQALGKRLKISKANLPEFRDTLARLVETGRVHEGRKGKIRLKAAAGLIAGIVKKISSGAGFVTPLDAQRGDRANDIYIDKGDLRDAHSGDEVLVRLVKSRRAGGQRSGRVEEITVRATRTFVGTYFERDEQGYVQVDGGVFTEPVLVGDPGAKGARPKDKVVIEMLRFPSHYVAGEAVLTKVLGPRGAPGVDTLSIIHEFGLPDEFPSEVLDEASEQATAFDEKNLSGRRDLTNETIITIDPVDARDFDDAISLTRTSDGHWHLGVHIADVAHFVTSGSALDREAVKRGTSVYLPDRVLPMLPEIISNGLASLQKGKVRFTQSAFIEFNETGVPIATDFARSAINVAWRFAYEEVMPLLREPQKENSPVPKQIRELLGRMHELAMLLRKRRFAAGALELTIGEVKLDFDEEGKVSGAHEVEHDESHQIIEEFMLAANIAVATKFADRGMLFLRRGHGEPDFVKLRAFAEFAGALGYPIQQFQSRLALQSLLDQAHGQPNERALNYALLRSMKQAEYTANDTGHYALAVENYCHFTSPIRRYPDLTIHRQFAELVTAKKKVRGIPPEEVERLAKHCSETERRAERAERELIKVKLLAFLADKIGEEFEAVITGVENFGIFCLGIQLPVEGLIHISALDRDDFFDYDARSFSLVGRRSGKQYQLGDRLRVRVANVDVDRRLLEFALAAEGEQPAGGPQRKTASSRGFAPRGGGHRGRRQESQAGRERSGAGRKGSSTRRGKTRRDGKKSKRGRKRG